MNGRKAVRRRRSLIAHQFGSTRKIAWGARGQVVGTGSRTADPAGIGAVEDPFDRIGPLARCCVPHRKRPSCPALQRQKGLVTEVPESQKRNSPSPDPPRCHQRGTSSGFISSRDPARGADQVRWAHRSSRCRISRADTGHVGMLHAGRFSSAMPIACRGARLPFVLLVLRCAALCARSLASPRPSPNPRGGRQQGSRHDAVQAADTRYSRLVGRRAAGSVLNKMAAVETSSLLIVLELNHL